MAPTLHSADFRSSARDRQFDLQAIFDSSSNAVIAIDRDGVVLMYNQNIEKALLRQGVTVQKGLNIFEALGSEERMLWQSASERAIAGERVSVDREYDLEEGKRLIHFTVFPLYAQDEIIGACLTGEDITRDRELASALERSEEDHRRLFNENPLPIWIVDRETFRILHVNEAVCDLYGYTREELSSKTVVDLRIPEDLDLFYDKQASLIQSPGDEILDARHQIKSGELITVRLYTHPITFNGRPARVALLQDITAQLDAERSLRAANERFRLAAEAISSVVYEMDRLTNRFTTSTSFKTLTGFDYDLDPHILTMAWWYSRLHPDDVERVQSHIADASTTADRYEVEYRFQHKDGHYLYVWHRGVFIKNEDGIPIRVIGSVQDISIRKQMEAQLVEERNHALVAKASAEEMNLLKSNFLANMSHELRTPMSAILGFSQLISEISTDAEIQSFAATIESGATRLLATLNSLLDLARIEAKNVSVHPEAVEVNSLLKDICCLLEPLALEQTIELLFIPTKTDLTVLSDNEHLRTIATNLIGNAIKFTSKGSVIVRSFMGSEALDPISEIDSFSSYVIGCHPKGEIFSIVVQDTGAGIAKENLAMIFEEFKQESRGYNRTHEGNGLGLTISSRLAIAMDGSIEVQSAKGVGSTFILRLPITTKEKSED